MRGDMSNSGKLPDVAMVAPLQAEEEAEEGMLREYKQDGVKSVYGSN